MSVGRWILNEWPPSHEDRGAALSDCDRYRYQLWRCWDRTLPPMGFVMLNPSTANAMEDDPTIRRCIGFARREGCGGIAVANLSPWRATSPAEMDAAIARGSGTVTAHYQFVTEAMHHAEIVVMAWGALSSRPPRSRVWLAENREAIAAALFKDRPGRDLLCLGRNMDASPKHPLYLPLDAPLVLWRSDR